MSSLLDSAIFDAGVSGPMTPGPVTAGVAKKVRNPDISEEYFGAGYLGYGPPEVVLGRVADELQRVRGSRIYGIMTQDAKVGSAISILPQAALSKGVSYSRPIAYKSKPNETTDPEEAKNAQDEADKAVEAGQPRKKPKKILVDPQRQKDLEDADWSLEFVQYNHRRALSNGRSIEAWLYEMMLEGLTHGSEVAERIYDAQEEGQGPYPGMAVYGRQKTKTRGVWAYVVDRNYELVGILGITDKPGEYVLLPPEKFSIFTWNPAGSDPRGRSHLRTIWQPYYHKVQTWSEWFKFIQQCASVRTVGIMPEDADMMSDSTAGSNYSISVESSDSSHANVDQNPGLKFLKNLEIFHNGRVIVIPNGAQVNALPPAGDGTAFFKAIDVCNVEIATGIHNNPQVTTEAKHSNKANADQAQDLASLLFIFVAARAADLVYRMWFDLIAYNRGRAFAEKFTPNVMLIDVSNLDWEISASNVAKLFQIGYFTTKQLPGIDLRLGIDERDSDDEAAGPPVPFTTSPTGPGSGNQIPVKGGKSDSGGNQD